MIYTADLRHAQNTYEQPMKGCQEGEVARIHLSQNPEHCPIHNAWQRKSREFNSGDFPDNNVEVYSDYLLSETPAYSVIGGVYDILDASSGQTYTVEEHDAIEAGKILENIEGIDVMSPAKVALASLIQAKESGDVLQDDCILLNVSGGGVERLKSEKETEIVGPWISDVKENLVDKILESLN